MKTRNEAQDKVFSRFQCKDAKLQIFKKEKKEKGKEQRKKARLDL